MRVTKTNNNRMLLCAIFNLIIVLVSMIQQIFLFVVPAWLHFVFSLTNQITYVLLLWYLISALQFSGQAQSVLTPYYMMLGVSVLAIITQIVRAGSLDALAIINTVVILYAFIESFRIKSAFIASPIRIFIGLLIVKILSAFFIITHWPVGPFSPRMFVLIVELLSTFSLLFVLSRTGKLLQNHHSEIEKSDTFNPVDAE